MVLVNTLTVEAINTALIALQRGQSIVVGGEKETTVNNITISNSGGSGGSGLDFTPQINALDKRVGLLEKAEEVLREENERQNERLELLEGLGISNFTFDEVTRELSIELENGDTFDTTITSESFSMRVDNGELIIKIGDNEQRIPLPSGVQADWTETDSDDPAFIKHKIPIWITSGSADDNMSPIDSVTDGSMRPVTSNAVADKHYLTSADITNQVTVDNMQSVSSNAVSTAISMSDIEHQVGYWLDRPMFEKTISVPVENYTSQAITKILDTGVSGIVTVVDFRGVYIKGEWNNPSFVMHVPYTYINQIDNTFLMIYPYYNKPTNQFIVYLGGTYDNGYYSNGRIYITFRYIKQTTPV